MSATMDRTHNHNGPFDYVVYKAKEANLYPVDSGVEGFYYFHNDKEVIVTDNDDVRLATTKTQKVKVEIQTPDHLLVFQQDDTDYPSEGLMGLYIVVDAGTIHEDILDAIVDFIAENLSFYDEDDRHDMDIKIRVLEKISNASLYPFAQNPDAMIELDFHGGKAIITLG